MIKSPVAARSFVLLGMFAMCMAANAQSQPIGPVPPGCLKELSGRVSCPPMGGEVHMTLSGEVVCGKGRCVRDLSGKVTCSTVPAGQVSQDALGNVTCAGGCEEASPSYCQALR